MKRSYVFNHKYPRVKDASTYNGIITRAMINEWYENKLPIKIRTFLTLGLTFYKEKPKPWEITDEWFVERIFGSNEKMPKGDEAEGFMSYLLGKMIEAGYVSYDNDIYYVKDMVAADD